MFYYCFYMSPLGEVRLECNEKALTGCWFSGQKYEPDKRGIEDSDFPILLTAKQWLFSYFHGEVKTVPFKMHLEGSIFRKEVWKILQNIPYGEVVTYSDIAKQICAVSGKEKMSAQAVGGAVGHNPISIFIPCHRVIGRGGELTGYAGGIERKKALLLFEDLKIETIQKRSGYAYIVNKKV